MASFHNSFECDYFLVNFPVVSGGFALLAILTSQTQALGALGLGGTALFSTSYVGGAAALLGMLHFDT